MLAITLSLIIVTLTSPFVIFHYPRLCDNFALHNIKKEDNTEKDGRRRKKNKYAKFSEVDKMKSDPLEALILESNVKIREIKKEIALKSNKKVELDEESLLARKEEKRVRNKRVFPDPATIDPYDPTTYGYTELGTIVGSHGIHGLVKIAAVTGFTERLCKPGIRYLKAPNRRSPREIRLMEGRLTLNNVFLVKFENIGDRNDANSLRGFVLYARQEDRPEDIAEDEYLVTDLIGLEIKLVTGYGYNLDEEGGDDNDSIYTGGKFIGTVRGIVLAEDMSSIPGVGHDWLEVVLPKAAGSPSWRDEMFLVPMVPEIVPTIDIERKVIYVDPPEGLLDLKYFHEERVFIKGLLPPAKATEEDLME